MPYRALSRFFTSHLTSRLDLLCSVSCLCEALAACSFTAPVGIRAARAEPHEERGGSWPPRPKPRLAQLEPSQEEEEFEPDDAFQNLFHRHVRQGEPPMRKDRMWEASIKVEISRFSRTLKAGEFVDWLTVERVFEFMDAHENRKESMYVEEYTKDFYELVARNDLLDSEQQLVLRYLGGLRQSIQDVLCLHTFCSVYEVFQMALAVEKQQTRSRNRICTSHNKFVRPNQTEHGAKSQEFDVVIPKRPSVVRGVGLETLLVHRTKLLNALSVEN
ncbi:hypothetical protein Tco_1013128 [Tanacetum coccineum]